jgi:hypothetical protein
MTMARSFFIRLLVGGGVSEAGEEERGGEQDMPQLG